jgi:hypothetical protein
MPAGRRRLRGKIRKGKYSELVRNVPTLWLILL